MFNDLDGSMDSREDDFEKKAEDPKFIGFHRLEKGLFTDKSTAGLTPIADQLMADTLDLQKRIDGLTIAPKNLVGGAAELIEEVASKKITGEEDRYSRTDLWDFQANVDGAQKIVALLNPLIVKQDPKLSARLHENFAKVDTLLAKYRTKDGGFESYEKLSDHGPQRASRGLSRRSPRIFPRSRARSASSRSEASEPNDVAPGSGGLSVLVGFVRSRREPTRAATRQARSPDGLGGRRHRLGARLSGPGDAGRNAGARR